MADITEQIAASADDGHCRDAANFPTGWNSPIARSAYITGQRWSVAIPEGSTIGLGSYVSYCSYGDYGGGNTCRIQVFNEDDATDFSALFWARAVMAGYVDWAPAGWATGTWYNTPELQTIIQAFIDRPGYSSGNHIGIRTAYQAADGGYVWCENWDHDTALAAEIHIEYTAPPEIVGPFPTHFVTP